MEEQSISEMIRQVSENNTIFFNAIADHIDRLQNKLEELENTIKELQSPATTDE